MHSALCAVAGRRTRAPGCGLGLHTRLRGDRAGIYHISGNLDQREYQVKLLDPQSGKSSVVGEIEGRLYLGQGLAVSPDGKTIFFAASTQVGADLMLVENFRLPRSPSTTL